MFSKNIYYFGNTSYFITFSWYGIRLELEKKKKYLKINSNILGEILSKTGFDSEFFESCLKIRKCF